MGSLREPVVSGLFYPQNKRELLVMLTLFFRQTKKVIPESKKVTALIVPHAGYIYSGQTAAWGHKQLPSKRKDKHFVLIGPSHQFPLSGLCGDTSLAWQTPLGKVKHKPLKKEMLGFYLDDGPHLNEHSLEVQLPFLQFLYPGKDGAYHDFSITCLLTGQEIDEEKTARYFLKSFSSSIFIISSDLSHYLPLEAAEKRDKKTIEAILNLDDQYFLKSENVACGAEGVLILLAMAKEKNWQTKLIFYDTSATASEDESGVVGYCALVFHN